MLALPCLVVPRPVSSPGQSSAGTPSTLSPQNVAITVTFYAGAIGLALCEDLDPQATIQVPVTSGPRLAVNRGVEGG